MTKALKTNSIFLFLALLFAQTLSAQSSLGMGTPQDAIREVIKEAYVDGVFNEGNLRNIELGFSEDFEMLIFEDNEIRKMSRADWIARVKEKQREGAYPPAPTAMVRIEYLNIDVEGDVAVAKIRFYRGNKLEYIDFLTLYHYQEGWKLVSKAFHPVPQTKE